MSLSLKANAAGTQGEILLNGNPILTVEAADLKSNVTQGAAVNSLTRKDYVDGLPAVVSNASGICMKYPDGTMVFMGEVTYSPLAFTSINGIWISESFTAFTFPQAFVAPPKLQMSVNDQAVSARSAYCGTAAANTTAVTSAWLISPVTAQPPTSVLSLTCIAWGRWKP